jgi:hypothetical protein
MCSGLSRLDKSLVYRFSGQRRQEPARTWFSFYRRSKSSRVHLV